jgi:hypothetical protein
MPAGLARGQPDRKTGSKVPNSAAKNTRLAKMIRKFAGTLSILIGFQWSKGTSKIVMAIKESTGCVGETGNR